MKVEQAAPDAGGIVAAIVFVVVVVVAWWLLLAWAILGRPLLALPVAAFVGLVVLVGMHDAQALAMYAVVLLGVWRLAHRSSFERLVGRRLRSGWVRWWRYERRWRSTMAMCGLTKCYRLREHTPLLLKVISTPCCDRVLVRLLRGQCTEDYERAAPELAHAFGARSCRVREARPARQWLEFTTSDPLTGTVPALPVPETVDLEGVAVGLQEDGQSWRVQVLSTHMLIAGATGAGKGSVLWSLLRGLASEIRDGRVQVWAIDPKGGMELGPGKALFTRFAADSFEEMAELLEDAVVVMQERAKRLAGVTRRHTPTAAEPRPNTQPTI